MCAWFAAEDLDKFLLAPIDNRGRSWWQSLLGVSAAEDSRLKGHLSPSTAFPWLQAGSKCGHEQVVQLCIEYINSQPLPVKMQLLKSFDEAHADRLLAARHQKLSTAYRQVNLLSKDLSTASSKLDKVSNLLGARTVASCTCSRATCQKTWLGQVIENAYCPSCQCKMSSLPVFL
jgi:hypothetical protein